jgi:hypothetical protein
MELATSNGFHEGIRAATAAPQLVSAADTAALTAVVAYALVSIFVTLGCAFLFAAIPEPAG